MINEELPLNFFGVCFFLNIRGEIRGLLDGLMNSLLIATNFPDTGPSTRVLRGIIMGPVRPALRYSARSASMHNPSYINRSSLPRPRNSHDGDLGDSSGSSPASRPLLLRLGMDLLAFRPTFLLPGALSFSCCHSCPSHLSFLCRYMTDWMSSGARRTYILQLRLADGG
jgi:hypothetical protein